MAANLYIHIGENPFLSFGYTEAIEIAIKAECVWIGEAAFLKAMIKKDDERYIPLFVRLVLDLIPVSCTTKVTTDIVSQIANFKKGNHAMFKTSEPEAVAKFLVERIGEKVYSVSSSAVVWDIIQ